MTRKPGFMDFNLFAKAIDELSKTSGSIKHDAPIWLHHFGESLLHPEFDRCIIHAAQKNIRTGLSINPVMLTDDVADRLLSSGLSVLYVSLDGHDDDSFMKIRGMKNAYTVSRERLLAFLDKKNKREIPVKIILSMINFPANRESIDISGKFWESVPGIDMFLPKTFTSWDGSDAAVNSLIDEKVIHQFEKSRVRCSIPWNSMTIVWNGDVVPCCFDYDTKYILGSIADSTLAEIWNGKKMQHLRNEFSDNAVRNSLCVNCERLYMPTELITL